MKHLPLLAGDVALLFQQLMVLGAQEAAWSGAVIDPYVNLRDTKVQLIEQIAAAVIVALKSEGLSDIEADFLEPHAWELMKRIQDSALRRCHVMEGA